MADCWPQPLTRGGHVGGGNKTITIIMIIVTLIIAST